MTLFSFQTKQCLGLFVLILGVAGCGQNVSQPAISDADARSAEDLYVVDCLLPAQVRKLGKIAYLGPKKPIKTTANDCAIRGGEYVSFDRADYRTALNVWLEQAKGGDAEAQNYVGEIFEKGLGQSPDFKSAASWYAKAAEQGFERAMINLGYLYEKGLGVEKNVALSLNYYRQASGLEGDTLVLDSAAKAELKNAKDALDQQVAAAELQTQYLNSQIESLEQTLASSGARETETQLAQAEAQIAALKQLYERAQEDKASLSEQLAGVALAYRNVETAPLLGPTKLQAVDERKLKDLNFGRYYAIIIGNQDYLFMDDLRSPMRDAKRLQAVLEEDYGFSTILLSNADEKIILNTLNELHAQLTEKDNLLIYYAGHGNISDSTQSSRERGYWLPVDARSESISNWINNAVISDHLDRLKTRSTLVIADSCYAGQLGAEGSAFLFGSGSGGSLSRKSVESGLSHKSRIVISSGGVKPVLDGTDQNHSVFASSLLEVLESNQNILRDSMLFAQLAVNVRQRNKLVDLESTPEMKPIRSAGHEGGAFYFVPAL